MNSLKLDKDLHDRSTFDCGVESLNRYLIAMANQQSGKDNARTYVITDPNRHETIIGYYSLTMSTLDLAVLPVALQKKHNNARSAGLIARLAVDKNFTKQGYGEWLLVDALHRLLDASDTVGFPIVTVDAKEGVSGFYQRFGFQCFQDLPNKLFMTIADIRASLS